MRKMLALTVSLGVLFGLLFVTETALADTEQHSCSRFYCYDPSDFTYYYQSAGCSVTYDVSSGHSGIATYCNDGLGPLSGSSCFTGYSSPQNSAYSPRPVHDECYIGNNPENGAKTGGCEVGFNADTSITCDSVGNPDSSCSPFQQAGSCPEFGYCGCEAFENECCNLVPSGCKSVLGCPTEPTATPTPAAYCTLSCPGTSYGDGSGGDAITDTSDTAVAGATTLAQQTGTGDGKTGTYGFGEVVGDIIFNGYNNFACSTFTDGDEYSGACPDGSSGDSSGDTSGGTSTKGVSTTRSTIGQVLGVASQAVQEPTPWKRIKTVVGSVLGTSTLLAQNDSGGTGSGATSTSSWTYDARYHIMNGSESQTYTATAYATSGQSCSCSTTVECAATYQDVNEDSSIVDGCDNQCNFSVSPGLPVHGTDSITMTIDSPSGFDDLIIDWDNDKPNDALPADPDQQTEVPYTYSNAGVYNIQVTCSTPGETRTCTRKLTNYCNGTDPGSLPTPTPTPPSAWFKVKDTAYNSKLGTQSIVPDEAAAYDDSDNYACNDSATSPLACFNTGDAGLVAIGNAQANFGARVSEREWNMSDSTYTFNTLLTPSTYIEYVQARKEYATTTSINDVTPGQINIVEPEGIVSITNDNFEDLVSGAPTLVIVDGDLVIDMGPSAGFTFNEANNPIALLVTGTLQISEDTTELNGIFVTEAIDYAYDATPTTTTPLKINGNISVTSTPDEQCISVRQRDDNELQPSCYVTFDFENQYLPLINLISTRTYEWTELVP